MESVYCAVDLSLIRTNYVSACHRGGPGSVAGLSLGDLCGKLALGKVFLKVFRFFLVGIICHCSVHVSIYTLLLPEGEMGEAWKPSKRQCCFGSQGALGRKTPFTFLSLKI